MLSSLTTPKRRRGLRGKASRERIAAAEAVTASASSPTDSLDSSFSLGTSSSTTSSSRASTSSLASARTVSKTSMATSMTSLSPTSSSSSHSVLNASGATSEHRYPAVKADELAGRSAIEVFKQRLAGGKHLRKESSSTPLRVVGRGGQGSRPRALPVDPNFIPPPLTTPAPTSLLARAPSPASLSPPAPIATRIVGRGGVGSRPRGLLAVDTPAIQFTAPPLAPYTTPQSRSPQARTAFTQPPEAPVTPLLYRPGGRGGAGSRPRKVKPPVEKGGVGVKDDGAAREFKFPWTGKGGLGSGKEAKGKQRAVEPPPPSVAMYGLTRIDTRASDVSGIAFALPAVRAHQKAVSPDPPTPPPVDVHVHNAGFGGQQQQRQRMNSKLARTLGAEVPFQWGIGAQAARMARRSSVSVPESPAPTDTDATTASSSARRQSSYGSLLLQHSRDNSSTSLSSEYRGDVWEPEEGYKRSTPGTPPFGAYYPAPPSPFLAALNPDSSEYEDDADDASEILSFHADHDIEFASLYSDPPETDDGYGFGDGDGEDGFEFEFGGGALTPMGGTRAGTPVSIALSAEDRQRFESPFQVMPLFVLPWEPAASAPQPDDGREEGGAWEGEWNRADMQVVIRGLRGLRG